MPKPLDLLTEDQITELKDRLDRTQLEIQDRFGMHIEGILSREGFARLIDALDREDLMIITSTFAEEKGTPPNAPAA